MSEYIYIDGRFYRAGKARISVKDRGFLYGDGVFETMRSYSGSVLMLSSHLNRLFHSLKVLKFYPAFSRSCIEDAVLKTLVKNRLTRKDAYIKIMVTRGDHSGVLHFNSGSRPRVIIIAKKLISYNGAIYSEGVDIISSSIMRHASGDQTHKHKLMSYFDNLYEKDRAHSQGAFESIFLTRDKLILEGSTTNIFMVKHSRVYTPALTQNILPGITRRVVLDLCRGNHICVWEKKLHYRDLINADEVFLTNSIAEVIPVRKIDAYRLGSRVPGKTTAKLMSLLRDLKKFTKEKAGVNI
ncbi:MAG TPA: branched-chain amino acid aminotransferase [Actinobacteria bacterium]|nr:branched-chain amino acid aminotransferase [Actinomycetota bacterium]